MLIEMLKAKLHRAVLTQCELNYTGSISIDRDLLDMAGILPFEKVLVVNQNNGSRLETYAIAAERGSRVFCLNGAAARLGTPGDMVTIMSFIQMTPEEAASWQPKAILLSDNNAKATII
ncbi:MAG: aspartate 1-decarboxylase [Victivallales bacterium]|nr:aspartate 1-decarboxylase [Victivallales bacterium]